MATISDVNGNNSLGTAQNIDGFFTVTADPDVQDSGAVPHVTIVAQGEGAFDWFEFTVPHAAMTGVFDIDYGISFLGAIDTELFLYDDAGTLLATNDDSDPALGAGGSLFSFDSLISYTFWTPGTYYIVVGEWPSAGLPGGPVGNAPDPGDIYLLQVSLAPSPLWQHIADITWGGPDGGYQFTGFADTDHGYVLTGGTVAGTANLIEWTLDGDGNVQSWARDYVDSLAPINLDGDDVIQTGDLADYVAAGDGDDRVFARGGNDYVRGEGGDDELHGENGDDTLRGGADDDKLYGGAGNDVLHGDGGNDQIWTGGGADEVVFAGAGDGASALDIVWDFQVGLDMIVDESGALALAGASPWSSGAYNAEVGQWGTLLQADSGGGEVDRLFLVGVGVDPSTALDNLVVS